MRRQYGEARLIDCYYQGARSPLIGRFSKNFQTYESEQVVEMAVRFHE